MKNSIHLLALLLIISINNDPVSQVTQEWTARYNGTGNSADQPTSMAIDAAGNIYVAGWSNGVNSGADFILIKYSSSGNLIWSQTYNGPANGDDNVSSVAIDGSGNIVISGTSPGIGTWNDYATVKYNSNGQQLWVTRYNGPASLHDIAYGMAVDNNGNIYVTGSSNAHGSSEDYATVKYNTDGVQQWIMGFNSSSNGDDIAVSVALDEAGNIYVTGTASGPIDYVTIKYNPAGNELWQKRYNWAGTATDYAKSIVVDGAGNSFITGSTYSNSSQWNYATVKYDVSGTMVWNKGYYGTEVHYWSNEHSNAIAIDVSGNVYVTGGSTNSPQPFDMAFATIKYNSQGAIQWINRHDGPVIGDDVANSIAVDDAGGVYVTGVSAGTGSDYLSVKYNSAGTLMWQMRYDGTANETDYAEKILVDNSGNVFVTGWSKGAGSDFDIVTIKYSQIVGIQPISGVIPSEYSLSQNYPNPFNPSTKIKFSIPVGNGRDRSVLIIFDALGREIETLVNEQLNPGTYEINWNASNHPSGVYFYKLISGNFSQTNKMILIK